MNQNPTASNLGVFLVWMGGLALVGSMIFFGFALLGRLMLPPLFVLFYVVLHYVLWGSWLGPRLKKLAEEQPAREEKQEEG